MKNYISLFIVLLFSFFLASCAGSTIKIKPEPWDNKEKLMLATALAFQAADYLQTRSFISDHNDGISEANPLITNKTNLALVKITSAMVIIPILHFLPHKARKWALGIWGGVGAGTVIHNHRHGVRFIGDML